MDLQQLMDIITGAKSKYYKLILVVSPFAETNTRHLKEASERFKYPYVNFSLVLSAKLIDIPVNKRRSHIINLLPGFTKAYVGDVILLDHIELLFLPDLGVDPVRAL
ncbi:BREX-3 system P-loop-containing protein BrxF [Desulfallas sp. Bu1-1]|uniref:BREX-3 system P-loop-containing protein BrxF n=1 Tax=Desulfallas sp. Bu1-1 TaxID=2787620 RepID=UPI00189D81A1|nr:BREX-3 system P-loop-containing protein BrxF [Desulfallas sp. Bu1-1]MBF7084493.1 BREX-3 system P-loop-containing protein BrxF [Desulfallas sp. Bu1-1]